MFAAPFGTGAVEGGALAKSVDYFIPPHLDGFERRRASLAVKTVFVLAMWGPIVGLLSWVFVGDAARALMILGAALLLLVSPMLLRWTGKPAVAGNYLVGTLFGVVVWLTWVNGGIVAPSFSWISLLPIFALLFAGKRSALFWMGAALCALGAFFGLHATGFEFVQQLDPWQQIVMRFAEVCGLTIVIFGVVYLKDGLQQWLVDVAQRNQQETRAIIETVPDGLVTVDGSGRVVQVNEAATDIFALDREAFTGRAMADLMPTYDRLQETAHGPAIAADAHIGELDCGRQFPMEVAAGELESSSHAELVLIMRDISRRKAAEEKVRQARDEALEASRAKSAFLANMSHELRTPLNAVIGYSEMIAEEIEFARQEDAPGSGFGSLFLPDVQRIRTAGKHLLALVNDILDLSKIEAGKMQRHIERIDVAELVDDVVSTVQPLADKNDNTLQVSVGESVDHVHSDLTKVRQILFNLLSNACKFTSDGQVRLDVRTSSDGERIVFRVEDTGIGMTPEQLDEVFEAFSQADSSTTRQFGGTGLGLTITSHFCALLGGTISVESTEGEGSVFTVELSADLRDEARTETSPPDTQDMVGAQEMVGIVGATGELPYLNAQTDAETILVIDDDRAMRNLLSRVLSKEGYNVALAASGAEGLLLAEQLQPAAITLDVMMPSMDGWELLARLKEEPSLADIPVIVITMLSERSRGFALGADHYLVKPVDRAELLGVLGKVDGVGV
jgi:hypothetical protein